MRAGTFAVGLLVAGWLVAIVAWTAGLGWDNKLWYAPAAAFATASGLGFMQAIDAAEGRGAAIAVGLLALASALFYVLAWLIVVFALG